ncbi:hypothetical protein F4695_000693 [Rhizobium soli]|uniref:Uncharacterized protein n=1 Tax=Rhizobium soli TaxID=424798 RepID=A0A7X0JH04_9HYPH|nr:hypothetical protein [Rhizobium soli]MBB6507374.1 hypothetical protein [Rhizobium soli]
MRLSVLIRGNNYIEKDRFGLPMDARNNIDSIVENIVAPVREKNPDAKIYLATYASPALAELQEKLSPCELIKLDARGSSQIETYKEGLKHVFGNDEYDALVVTRFDLQFKKTISDWNLDIARDSIYFPFKEYKSYWRDHWRVGDAVHVIGKGAMAHFYNAMIINQLSGRAHLHLMYYFLRTMHAHLRFIEDGYFDSNTLFANPECDNPLYKIFNRQRLTTPSPSMGMQLGEIQAE